jgi:hypothetical protein
VFDRPNLTQLENPEVSGNVTETAKRVDADNIVLAAILPR